MSATMKQVATVEMGEYRLELDEAKLKKLADICDYAEQNIQDLTDLNDQLLELTDNFAGLDTQVFPFLRTLVDIKRDYQAILSLGIERKEAHHG